MVYNHGKTTLLILIRPSVEWTRCSNDTFCFRI